MATEEEFSVFRPTPVLDRKEKLKICQNKQSKGFIVVKRKVLDD